MDAGTEEASGVTTAGAAGAAEDWQMGNASAEAATIALGGAAEDGPGAAPATKGRKKRKTRAKHRPGNLRHRNKRAGAVSAAHLAYTGLHCLGGPKELGPPVSSIARTRKTKRVQWVKFTLNRGQYPLSLHPFDTTKTKNEKKSGTGTIPRKGTTVYRQSTTAALEIFVL